MRKLQLKAVTIDAQVIPPLTLKSVLRSIYDHANPVCWASTATLAEETNCSKRTVQRALMGLERLGYITIEKLPGRSSEIRIVWEKFQYESDDESKVTDAKSSGEFTYSGQANEQQISAMTSDYQSPVKNNNQRLSVTPPATIGDSESPHQRLLVTLNQSKPRETGFKPEDHNSFLGGRKPGSRRWGVKQAPSMNGGRYVR